MSVCVNILICLFVAVCNRLNNAPVRLYETNVRHTTTQYIPMFGCLYITLNNRVIPHQAF